MLQNSLVAGRAIFLGEAHVDEFTTYKRCTSFRSEYPAPATTGDVAADAGRVFPAPTTPEEVGVAVHRGIAGRRGIGQIGFVAKSRAAGKGRALRCKPLGLRRRPLPSIADEGLSMRQNRALPTVAPPADPQITCRRSGWTFCERRRRRAPAGQAARTPCQRISRGTGRSSLVRTWRG